ncbi:hypothetical protein F66182_497 [Fusarium sp. NRRL 66182]|nr:hypothetical protein F66182_497 [Fusarium sp. NRRL 66182]
MDTRHLGFADKVGRGLTNGILFATRRWKLIMLSYVFVAAMGSALLYMHTGTWGGYDQRPQSEKCYRQERTAMLLNLFLGCFGIDQFYAHHWPLAVFKMLTFGGIGLWALIDQILWTVGGVYGTPGCPGGSSKGWQY